MLVFHNMEAYILSVCLFKVCDIEIVSLPCFLFFFVHSFILFANSWEVSKHCLEFDNFAIHDKIVAGDVGYDLCRKMFQSEESSFIPACRYYVSIPHSTSGLSRQ